MTQSRQFGLVLLTIAASLFSRPCWAQTDVSISLSGTSYSVICEGCPPPNPIRPGGMAFYTFVVTNKGPAPANDVTATLTLPPLTEVIHVFPLSPTGPTCSSSNVSGQPTVTCTRSQMTVGASFAEAVDVRLDPTYPWQLPLVATASVTSTTPDSVSSNNTVSFVLPVAPPLTIPTLSQVAALLLILTLALVGVAVLR